MGLEVCKVTVVTLQTAPSMGCVESSRVETVEHGNVQTDTSDQADAQRDGPPALAQSLLDQSELERGEAAEAAATLAAAAEAARDAGAFKLGMKWDMEATAMEE